MATSPTTTLTTEPTAEPGSSLDKPLYYQAKEDPGTVAHQAKVLANAEAALATQKDLVKVLAAPQPQAPAQDANLWHGYFYACLAGIAQHSGDATHAVPSAASMADDALAAYRRRYPVPSAS
jgi:hypothetical protein